MGTVKVTNLNSSHCNIRYFNQAYQEISAPLFEQQKTFEQWLTTENGIILKSVMMKMKLIQISTQEVYSNGDTKLEYKGWKNLVTKKQDLMKKIDDNKEQIKTIKKDLDEAKKSDKKEEVKKIEDSLKELNIEAEKLLDEKIYLEKEEKAQPLNVDTLSQPGFSKTIINKSQKKKEELSEDEQLERSKKFMDENREDIKKYGMLHEYHDSQALLLQKPHLACEDTANYLVVWCIDLEVEEKHALMERVAHQTICMQFLLELSKQLEIDPRSTGKPFFQ